MPNINETPPSRLTTSTVELRDSLESRNLYTPNSEYPLQSSSNAPKVVSTINTIIGGLTPFKSYNLENTVYGRLIQGNANTPLAQIGLAMLGKQMALNMMSNGAQQLLPVIKVSNLFDGNPNTHLFTPHKDFGITKIEGQTDLRNFVNRIVGRKNPDLNPFNELSDNSNYLRNTGSGQLVFLFDQLNKNVYKSANVVLNEVAINVKDPIQPRSNIVSKGNVTFFNFGDGNQYPYSKYYPSNQSTVDADTAMINASNVTPNSLEENKSNQEYAPDRTFIDNLGRAFKYGNRINQDLNNKSGLYESWIGSNTEFMNDGNFNKIIWGKSGVDANTATLLNEYRGDFGNTAVSEDTSFNTDFGVKGAGLLEYTRNLIRATEGQVGDLTRKAFVKGSEIVGFNGSPLWKANNSTYALRRNQAGHTGVRQHSALDPYDRFAKAIRFDGNILYGGNENSVIYKSVLPRIHPTINTINNKSTLDNKNLMLSIENLAIRVISKNDVGIIDDEYGSEIPACEVGAFGGRMMWFPPYAMELNETATAKYESTVMVGRNEPMYNYQNSERTATLSFTLLVDYPPHVRNYMKGNSSMPQKDIADFFAFGGNAISGSQNITNLEKKLDDLKKQKESLNTKLIPDSFDAPTPPPPLRVHFPNDLPKIGQEKTIIDTIYKRGYEVHPDFLVDSSSYDGKCYGLNQHIYSIVGTLDGTNVISGRTYYSFPSPPTYSQYDEVGRDLAYGSNRLNVMLMDMFQNPEMRKYFDIEIVGHCSSPESDDYNLKLGTRRAEALKYLVVRKLQKLGIKSTDITFKVTSLGEKGSGDLDKEISSKAAKDNRYAQITITRNKTVYVNPSNKTQFAENQKLIEELDKEIAALQTKINNSKSGKIDAGNLAESCVMKERYEDDTAILHGFKSFSDNYYYPIFHSQTPEDFHKRLTFLQQCTRQGAAKRYNVEVDSNGVSRAKNSVFGRQPICILRVGDFFYTKVVIESINLDYTDTTWDMNPEGFGMQPMLAKVTLNMKVIGGQSLKGPIDALQNAVSFNYYANSNYTDKGIYGLPSKIADKQQSYMNGILTKESSALITAFENKFPERK